MKLLLTNDDGIDAPGLAALQQAVAKLGSAITVAPHEHLSGCSHQTTTNRGLKLTEVASSRYSLDGTPADCTRVGLLHVEPDVDWVLSGINEGGNLGVDVFMSGTVAAVREAALLGKPAVAFSQYQTGREPFDWQATAQLVEHLLPELMSHRLQPGAFWNVNFPDPVACRQKPKVVFCPLDHEPLPVSYHQQDGLFHYRADYHGRPRRNGSDVDVCFSGNIAVTQIPIGGGS